MLSFKIEISWTDPLSIYGWPRKPKGYWSKKCETNRETNGYRITKHISCACCKWHWYTTSSLHSVQIYSSIWHLVWERSTSFCIYNRSKSGWFDSETFIDWFEKIIVPFFHGKEGKKCMIGDNLSSHLSPEVLDICEKEGMIYCFLPPKATHLLQPLDVCVFNPLKKAWQEVL